MFLNADTLTNEIPEFECLIKNYQPRIIGVNEVLPKNFKRKVHAAEFGLKNYEMYAHKNVSDNIDRGSLFYVHNSHISKQVDLKTEHFEEAIFVEIKINKSQTLLCACMYRRGESSEENNSVLLKALHEICNSSYSHVLIMGDLNFPDIDWKRPTGTFPQKWGYHPQRPPRGKTRIPRGCCTELLKSCWRQHNNPRLLCSRPPWRHIQTQILIFLPGPIQEVWRGHHARLWCGRDHKGYHGHIHMHCWKNKEH